MGCDAAVSIPALPAPVIALAPLRDLDGDVSGAARPGVLLVDAVQLAALRPATGSVSRGLTEAGVTTHVLTSVDALAGLGSSIIGSADVTGDGVVDLVVGAPNASFAAAGAGVALVFAGGAESTGMQRPWMLVTGDDGPAPAGLGGATALLPAASGRPAFMAVGSPSSARSGAGIGAGYLLAFP